MVFAKKLFCVIYSASRVAEFMYEYKIGISLERYLLFYEYLTTIVVAGVAPRQDVRKFFEEGVCQKV